MQVDVLARLRAVAVNTLAPVIARGVGEDTGVGAESARDLYGILPPKPDLAGISRTIDFPTSF